MASQYPRNIITAKGYNLLAESIATKKAVVFTKVVVGNGDDSGKNISQMTNVISPKMTLPVSSAVKDGDGQYMITATLSNSTVEEGFFPKEVALFAKGDGGEEVMYSYTNGGNQVGYIPDKNTPIDSEIYKIRTKIGNASNITFIHQDATYITQGELMEHDKSTDAHENRFREIIEKANNMITDVDNNDVQLKAPTLHLVKTLLSALKIKDGKDVVKALGDETLVTLGVTYNFSNTNAWYICFGKLFGGLIVQGGVVTAGEQVDGTKHTVEQFARPITFPLAFKSACLMPVFTIFPNLQSVFWGNSSATVMAREITTTGMRYEVRSVYKSMLDKDSTINWIALGY